MGKLRPRKNGVCKKKVTAPNLPSCILEKNIHLGKSTNPVKQLTAERALGQPDPRTLIWAAEIQERTRPLRGERTRDTECPEGGAGLERKNEESTYGLTLQGKEAGRDRSPRKNSKDPEGKKFR